ncbi:MAG: hypothetical protein ACKVZH_20345 [Blastocatellia bacterium]
MTKVGSNTGNASISTDVSSLVSQIKFDLASGATYNTVSGSITNGDAKVLLQPITGDLTSSAIGLYQMFYAQTAIHETMHLAGKNGTHSDYEIARAINDLGLFTSAEQQEFQQIATLSGTAKEDQSSLLWDKVLDKNCPKK